MAVEKINVVIGEYSDYLDTGIWTLENGKLEPPPDLTPNQLRDFHLVFGGLVRSAKENGHRK